MSRSSHRRCFIKKLTEMGYDLIMFHIYLFQFGIITFAFFPEAVERKYSWQLFLKISQNSQKSTCTGVPFLASSSNFINEETPAQCFPKPLTVFAKSYIVYVRLGYKYDSVLHLELKPSCKDFLLWKSVIKILNVLYYHHRFIIQRNKNEQQSNEFK